jgi:hypothetical protein
VSGGPASRTSGTFRQRASLPEVRLTISRRNCEARWSAFGGGPASRTSGTFRQWDSLAEVRLAASRPGSGAFRARCSRILAGPAVVAAGPHGAWPPVCADRRRATAAHASRLRVRGSSSHRRPGPRKPSACARTVEFTTAGAHRDGLRAPDVAMATARAHGRPACAPDVGNGARAGWRWRAARLAVAWQQGWRWRAAGLAVAWQQGWRWRAAPAATGRRDPCAPQARWTFMNAVENRRSRVRARQPYPGHGIPLPKGG